MSNDNVSDSSIKTLRNNAVEEKYDARPWENNENTDL